jgi:hypothetical protein
LISVQNAEASSGRGVADAAVVALAGSNVNGRVVGQSLLFDRLVTKDETTRLTASNAWTVYETTLMRRLVSSKA